MKLLKDKKFSSLFWTQFFGALNDNVLKNALALIITYKGLEYAGLKKEDLVALTAAIFILPFFLFSALAGEIADRYEKSKLIRVVKICEILIMVIATFGFVTAHILVLFFALFLMGVHSTFFGPMKYSMIPELVAPERLVEGNAHVESGTFIAILIGTITGGILSGLENMALWTSAVLFMVAIIGYYFGRQVPSVTIGNPDLQIDWNPIPTLINNFRIIRKKVAVYNSVLGISWFWFFGAGILSVLPIFCKDYLNANENVVTFFLAMFTLGVGIGSFVCEKFSYKRVELGLVPIGALGMSLFIADIYFVLPTWDTSIQIDLPTFLSHFSGIRLGIDFFLMSIFGGIFILPLYTLLQERSDRSERSRVIAGNNILNAVFMVIGSVFLMLLYHFHLSTTEIFLVFSVLNLLASVYIYFVVPEFTLRFYSWLLVRFLYKLKITGRDHIPTNGPVILACNHVSYVDWLLIAGACTRPSRFIMYYKFFDIPFFRFLMKHARVIPIAGAKEDESIMNAAFDRVHQELNEGEVVCIFPEGQLTDDGNMSPFRPGILKIAEKNPESVIVPMAIVGLWGGLFTRKKDGKQSLFRKPIELRIGVPFSAKDLKLDILEQKIKDLSK